MASDVRRLRCALYTRKSTEEGLDKVFNSLDAQREACAAYVMSQQHEGWTLLPDIYDDGGYSGGSMERPALRQLLADVRAGRVDVVVVYKIDRLTRSLSDFAKIVDVLEGASASFVSVTQAFSTTTSMGRLTLNVLLSFAQFEREVITERIRDKVAASKAKGMWMGGPVPLGYIVKDRMLVVEPEEAATVRLVMQRYVEGGTVRTLVEDLRHEGVLSKRRIMKDGTVRGGVPLHRGAVAWMLSNRVYVGETVHKGTAYPGQHEAIVERDLFDAVQAKLADRTAVAADPSPTKRVSLLAGMIRDDHGRPMSPCHTRNHGRRYSYYASSMNDDASAPALRLPAGELEVSIRNQIGNWLRNASQVRMLIPGCSASEMGQLLMACASLADELASGSVRNARATLQQIVAAVTVSGNGIMVTINPNAILMAARLEDANLPAIEIAIPTSLASFGHEPRLRIEPVGNHPTQSDDRLVELLARAFAARDQLLVMSEDELANLPVTKLRHLQRTARLSYLDPTIIRAVLTGRQPQHLSARDLWRVAELPLVWSEQRRLLDFAQP